MDSNATSSQPRYSGFRRNGAGVVHQTAEVSATPGTIVERGPQIVLALGVDALKLADLQLQLLTVDVREFWNRSWIALLSLAFGIAAGIAALPVVMMGAAETLQNASGISSALALLIVSGSVLLTAIGLIFGSLHKLTADVVPLKRSAQELRDNLTWMRTLLHDDAAAGSETASVR